MLAQATREASSFAHQFKSFLDWQIAPVPEFNDHFINQFFLMPAQKRTFWLEGAVFCGLGLGAGVNRILEICCGTGFYTDFFYSPFASEIVAVDYDPRAIEFAGKFHQQPNIKYELCDIRSSLPAGPFDAVIFDAAIEHFTAPEIDKIMAKMKSVGKDKFLLAGYTVAESADHPEHPDHETHFRGLEDLGLLLRRYFQNVRTFERIHPTLQPPRHNLFFYASDGPIPFDAEWPHGQRI
jgi:SAM-dependent methyltransferase